MTEFCDREHDAFLSRIFVEGIADDRIQPNVLEELGHTEITPPMNSASWGTDPKRLGALSRGKRERNRSRWSEVERPRSGDVGAKTAPLQLWPCA